MRTRPGLRYSWNPASARPVFWMCGLGGNRFAFVADDRHALAGAAPLALLPLAFDLVRLLRDFVDRDAQRRFPAAGIADPMQELLAPGVQRDVGAVPVLLARQHRMRRHGAVVERAFELGELGVDEAAKRGSDVDVTAGEFESHRDVRRSAGPCQARRSVENLALIERGNLQLFEVLRVREPREHETTELQDAYGLRIAMRHYRVFVLDDL